jgi:hypothetical protein
MTRGRAVVRHRHGQHHRNDRYCGAGGRRAGLDVQETTGMERWLQIIAGLALVYPKALLDYIGVALICYCDRAAEAA